MATTRVPDGLAPAVAVDLAAEVFVCRGCADRGDRIVFVLDETHLCVGCGQVITAPDNDAPAQ
jgi:hypothetical protein